MITRLKTSEAAPQPAYLLTTKLTRPPLQPNRVRRGRLLKRLDAMAGFRLLVAAPAGWGKTTLVNDWLGDAPNVAWVSLDSADNDPVRFWAYVFAALNGVQPHVGAHALTMLQRMHPPPVAALLTTVLNELSSHSDPVVLVLDDYHTIAHEAIHADMNLLLDRAPPRLQLVLTSRAEPPLALARRRARGQLRELRAADLHFDMAEATSFFVDVMRLDLTPKQIATLLARTEGWVAGLQLAGLALQESHDHADMIAGFAGTQRYILDYLTDEVLRGQPAAMQQFLLRTSLLERLNGSLCDALTGRDDGAFMLDQLARANLFVTPLDQLGQWYRYHHLFADVLRKRLRQTAPASVATIHERAAEWYVAHGDIPEAVPHLLAAQQWERATELIAQIADTLLRRGEAATLRGWLEALPADMLEAHVRLCRDYAWTLVIEGAWEHVEPRLRAVEQFLAARQRARERESSAPAYDQREVLGDLATMRAALALRLGDYGRVVHYCEHALAHLPAGALTSRGVALAYVINAHLQRGDLPAAQHAFDACATLSASTASPVLAQLATIARIRLALARRSLRSAAALCQHELQIAAEDVAANTQVAGEVQLELGSVLYEWDDLDGAAQHLTRGIELMRGTSNAEALVRGYLRLADVRRAQGAHAAAHELLAQAEHLAAVHPAPPLSARIAAHQIHVLLCQGNITAARQLARQWRPDSDAPLPITMREIMELAHARALAVQGQSQAALALLRPLRHAAESAQRCGAVMTLLIHEALVLAQSGATTRAVQTLAEALALAAPEGSMRTFLDHGEPIIALLHQVRAAQQQGQIDMIASDGANYVERVLAHAHAAAGAACSPARHLHEEGDPLPEPLRPREIEILQLVAEGRSTQEIAESVIVSVGTVRWHLKNIYSKLDVHSRTQAVARARALGLLR